MDNIGTVDSTGYNNYDYRRIFEVTTVLEDSQTTQSLPAGTPIYVRQNNETKIYYPKSVSDYNLQKEDSVNNGDYSTWATWGSYLINRPPLKQNEFVTFKFKGDFVAGNTYMVCADDILYYNSLGSADTVEIIDDDSNPSNNYFVFTVEESPPELRQNLNQNQNLPENLHLKKLYKLKL